MVGQADGIPGNRKHLYFHYTRRTRFADPDGEVDPSIRVAPALAWPHIVVPATEHAFAEFRPQGVTDPANTSDLRHDDAEPDAIDQVEFRARKGMPRNNGFNSRERLDPT